MVNEMVVLVDENDQDIGEMEKMEAHRKGVLHRAFSVFLFNNEGELLLQQRAFSKYHSGGLWTNTCCSHPRSGEAPLEAAKRRLMEEMGFTLDDLDPQFTFIYNRKLDNELTEHELDHVIFGRYNKVDFKFNPDEVASVKYVSLSFLREDMKVNPQEYTEWFKICFEEVERRRAV
ncbi:MAG: isopentenyl-diphosphate delta-isomerase [Psychroserpens sp.]|jgi:isopentenyl-diphosphate delta-isomerase